MLRSGLGCSVIEVVGVFVLFVHNCPVTPVIKAVFFIGLCYSNMGTKGIVAQSRKSGKVFYKDLYDFIA
jgi:hypothetical protein